MVSYAVLDNLKQGVIRPDLYEPQLNPLYAALLSHYGVVADPCRVRDPDRKGAVENAIQHTQGTALKGRQFELIEEQNSWLAHWEERLAAPRIHGRKKRQVREVHAEMAALTDAAKRGVSVRGCVLYCTTFPCHECARLIVSAGIKRVVYIEPYPKSRVAELYEDSIGLADRRTELGNRVCFEPFVGIAPRRYFELFSWVLRKAADMKGALQDYSGEIAPWLIGTASLRDSIVDAESLHSGARAEAITCGEMQNINAFQVRLAETEQAETEEQASSASAGTAPVANHL